MSEKAIVVVERPKRADVVAAGPIIPVGGATGSVAWGDVTGKPADFPPEVHGHTEYTLKVGMVPSQTTLAYDEGTRTVTLTGTNFDMFAGGTNYTKNTVSLAHPDTQGGHFFYYDDTGTFVTGQTPWDLTIHAPVCFVFWDEVNNRGVPFEERHNAGRDVFWHRNQHINEGTKVSSGFAASGYTINLQTDAGVTLAIATGRVEDEDIRIDTTPLPDAGPYTILERVGASGDWQVTRTSALPFLYTGTNIQYNQNNGGTWQRTNLTNTDYTNVWVFAATCLNAQDQYIFIPGQTEHASSALASAETVSSITWGNIPFQEIAPLYKLTYQFNNSYGGTARCRLTEVTRIVGTFASVTQAAVSDHGSLLGLSDDDHPIYGMAASSVGAVTYNAAGTSTIALDNGRTEHFTATAATGSTTWAVTGTTVSKSTGFILDLTNGGAFGQTFTGMKFDGGVQPTLTAAGKDRLVFQYDGTVWTMLLAAKDYK